MSPRRGFIFPYYLFLQRLSCYAAIFQQRSCKIFVDQCIAIFSKQRSCDILILFNFNRTKEKQTELNLTASMILIHFVP